MNLSPAALLAILCTGLCWLSMAGLCARPYTLTPPRLIRGLWLGSMAALLTFIFNLHL